MLTKSIYTFLFKEGDKCYLYNSRANFFSEISPEFYDVLDREQWGELPSEVLDRLKSLEVVIDDASQFDYYNRQLNLFHARNNNPLLLSLIIAPTTGCNFGCPYCFESKRNPKTISEETIQKLGEFVKGHPDAKKINLTWYGGEPLLALDKIRRIYEVLEGEDMPEISFQEIITNGYCFNQEAIDLFKEHHLDVIQITLDGVGADHDSKRYLVANKGATFDTIISNIDLLVKELPDTRINIRVNVNKKNYNVFFDVCRLIKERYPDAKNIGAYPGIIREETADCKQMCSECYGTSEALELYKTIREAGFSAQVFPRKAYRGCMMHTAGAYVVGPEGELYKCWNDVGNPETVIGNIASDAVQNETRLLRYAVEAIPFNEECRHCMAFPLCSGGCGHHRYRNMFEGCRFDLCSPYKDPEKLKNALLCGEIKL